MAGGELFTHLYQREHFTEDEVRIYIGEIILALEKLHAVSKSNRLGFYSNHFYVHWWFIRNDLARKHVLRCMHVPPSSLPSYYCCFRCQNQNLPADGYEDFSIVGNYRVWFRLFRNHFRIIFLAVLLSSTFCVGQTNIVLCGSRYFSHFMNVFCYAQCITTLMTIENTYCFVLLLLKWNAHVNIVIFRIKSNLKRFIEALTNRTKLYNVWGRSENKTQGWRHIISFNDDKSIFLRYLDEW